MSRGFAAPKAIAPPALRIRRADQARDGRANCGDRGDRGEDGGADFGVSGIAGVGKFERLKLGVRRERKELKEGLRRRMEGVDRRRSELRRGWYRRNLLWRRAVRRVILILGSKSIIFGHRSGRHPAHRKKLSQGSDPLRWQPLDGAVVHSEVDAEKADLEI